MAHLKTQHLWRGASLRFLFLTIGAVIGALEVTLFLAPFDIAPGGVSGVAVILNHLINTPIGLVILVGNIPIMFLAYKMLGGWRVIATTAYVLVVYSVGIDLLTPLVPAHGLSDNVLLNAIFGGVLGGISSGLAYRAGATFGGTSTLARILNQKLGLPLSATYLYTDMLVIGVAGVVFGWEAALYATIVLFVSGLATDYVLEGPSVIRTAVIITDCPQEVSSVVMAGTGRGVTGWQARGMYTGHEHTVLYVTLARSQVSELQRIVHRADPNAFVVIGQGHAAYGEGFRAPRRSS